MQAKLAREPLALGSALIYCTESSGVLHNNHKVILLRLFAGSVGGLWKNTMALAAVKNISNGWGKWGTVETSFVESQFPEGCNFLI